MYINKSDESLEEIPNDILNEIFCENLDLSNNQIKKISPEISNLKDLKILNLDNNPIEEFPKEILSLTNLEHLILSSTKIKEIPKEIVSLKNLKLLDLYNTQIKELPPEISNLKNLKGITLFKSPISKFPIDLGKIKNLLFLYVPFLPNSPEILGELENIIGNTIYLNKNYKEFFNNSVFTSKSANYILNYLENECFRLVNPNKILIQENTKPAIGVTELAKELSKIIVNIKDEKASMIGIFGRWGRGKTFLVEQIKKELEDNEDIKFTLKKFFIDFFSRVKKFFVDFFGRWGKGQIKEELNNNQDIKFTFIDFNAWKYQDNPSSWAYLYETIADEYFNFNFKNKIIQKILEGFLNIFKVWKINLEKIGWIPIIFFVLSICISIYFSGYLKTIIDFLKKEISIHLIRLIFSSIGVLSLIPILNKIFLTSKSKAIELYKKYSEKKSFENLLGLQAEIQKELKFLLKAWIPQRKLGKEKIVLFVDDIDRCSEEKLLQVIDSLRVILEDEDIYKRLQIIVAIDDKILERSICHKYKNLFIEDYNKNLQKEYIDKLFLLSIKLGQLNEDEKKEILKIHIEKKIEKKIKAEETEEIKELHNKTPVVINSTDIPQDIKNISTEISENGYELSEDESDILSDSLNQFSTPREIRIFYYRYMLAKNLLINKNIDKTIILKNLIKLIVMYSDFNYLSNLDNHIKIYETDGFLNRMNEIGVKLEGVILLDFLKVIQIVIAY